MQKVLMFTREEVVARLEQAGINILEAYEDTLPLTEDALYVPAIRLHASTENFLMDVEFFDVYINKKIFMDVKDLNVKLAEFIDSHDYTNAARELRELKAKVSSILG